MSFSRSIVRREKLDALVDFPIGSAEDGSDLLDMSDVVLGPSDAPLKYELYGISNHSGNLGGGHYTAYAKNFKNNKWYNFNDSSTSEVRSVPSIVTSQAYVLFYKRVEA